MVTTWKTCSYTYESMGFITRGFKTEFYPGCSHYDLVQVTLTSLSGFVCKTGVRTPISKRWLTQKKWVRNFMKTTKLNVIFIYTLLMGVNWMIFKNIHHKQFPSSWNNFLSRYFVKFFYKWKKKSYFVT